MREKKKNYTGSVCPSCSQSLQAFLLPTSLHIFLLFKQSFLKRHGAAFTQDTGPQVVHRQGLKGSTGWATGFIGAQISHRDCILQWINILLAQGHYGQIFALYSH